MPEKTKESVAFVAGQGNSGGNMAGSCRQTEDNRENEVAHHLHITTLLAIAHPTHQ